MNAAGTALGRSGCLPRWRPDGQQRSSCRCRLHRICDTFKDMKTSTLPPLRVEPRLRSQAERLLRAGETLSSFIVDAVEERVRNRAMEDEFVRRGLASAEKARRTGKYTSAAL